MPARVILQDFTGVPAVVDLASMRGAVKRLGGDARRINPLVPVDLVVDHSVQVDAFGSREALGDQRRHRVLEEPRAVRVPALGAEGFLQLPRGAAGDGHRPPGEPRVPRAGGDDAARGRAARWPSRTPWSGTDSHTTMINGLGVLGWGVGGIEAEAAMLGQPLYMLTPQVVGFKLTGRLREGVDRHRPRADRDPACCARRAWSRSSWSSTAPASAPMSLADRATIANMAPEYGATCGFFPVDEETPRLPAPHRPAARPGRPRRAVLQGAGAVPHRRPARSHLQRHAGPGPRRRSSRAWPARSGRRTASPWRR